MFTPKLPTSLRTLCTLCGPVALCFALCTTASLFSLASVAILFSEHATLPHYTSERHSVTLAFDVIAFLVISLSTSSCTNIRILTVVLTFLAWAARAAVYIA